MRKKRANGSTTVFLAISFMLITAFLFVLIECSRLVEVHKVCHMTSDIVMESIFSSYNVPAWENYHLLLLEGNENEGEFEIKNVESISKSISSDIINSGLNDMVSVGMDGVNIDSYQLITDDKGLVYQEAVCTYMKENIVYETMQEFMSKYKQVKDIKDSKEYGTTESTIQEAQNILSSKNQNKVNASGGQNPFDFATSLQAQGVLSLVIKDIGELSTKKLSRDELVSERSCKEGNWDEVYNKTLISDILLRLHAASVFSDYTNRKEQHPLEYELEYLISGKTQDIVNLELVVIELMAIREAANFIYLLTDSAKVAQALSLATILAGATANPAVIEVVKMGILAAWAFVESILDIRNLLQGGRVSLLKTPNEWRCTLLEMPTALSDWSVSENKTGFNYKDYLMALLFFQKSEEISYRCMDIQELTIRQEQGMEDFRMDYAVVRASATMNYKYKSIFHGLGNDLFSRRWNFNVEKKAEFSYF